MEDGVDSLVSTHKDRFTDELGRQDYMTGEMWKNKSPFRLALNMAGFGSHCLALQTLHRTWNHEVPRVWHSTCRRHGNTRLEAHYQASS